MAWVNSIYQNTGIDIPFPIIADRTGEIARLYGMFSPDVSIQDTVRNVYFIDPNQIIRAITIYPLTNGRNIYEILRLIDALQITDRDKVLTPANWLPGNPTLVPPPRTYDDLKIRQNNPESINLSCEDWYMCYTKPEQQMLTEQ